MKMFTAALFIGRPTPDFSNFVFITWRSSLKADPVSPGWNLQFCISNRLSGDAHASSLQVTPSK